MITADDWKGEYRDIKYEISAENKVSKPFLKVLFYVYDIEMDELRVQKAVKKLQNTLGNNI